MISEAYKQRVYDMARQRGTWSEQVEMIDELLSKLCERAGDERMILRDGRRECIECRTLFRPNRSDHIYCSGRCRTECYRNHVTVA